MGLAGDADDLPSDRQFLADAEGGDWDASAKGGR